MPQSKGKSRGRKVQRMRSVRQLLILCEDTKSSRDYLSSFPYDKRIVQIQCIGTGKNTNSLMQEAIKRAKIAQTNNTPFEQVWVVFDKDSFTQQQFNETFELARQYNEIIPCWSNECFELWYLLHFEFRDTAIGRKDLRTKLKALLGKKYDKADKLMFVELEDKIETALKNASKLAAKNNELGDAHRNPSTRVHELVEKLRNFDPKLQ